MVGYSIDRVEATKYSAIQQKGIVVVPEHGKEDIKPGTLNSILKQAGLK
jgi:predicted RNA binding protein YcfA (HicA-like mRNA interferase family)